MADDDPTLGGLLGPRPAMPATAPQPHGGGAPTSPPSWPERARYLRVLAEVREAAVREMDRAQVGDEPSQRLLAALEQGRLAHDRYLTDCRMAATDAAAEAAIRARGGTLEP